MSDRQRSVLVVEELAHWTNGHFPVRCAQVATGFADLGYHVELLTSEGWSRDDEHPQRPFVVSRYRAATRWVRRVVALGDRKARHQLLTLVLVVEARAAARRLRPAPDAIIVLGWYTDPTVVALVAGRRRWLVNQFREPDDVSTRRLELGRSVEARRRARGGRVRVAVALEGRRADWNERVPYLDPVVVPVAGTRDVEPVPDARQRLGLPPGRLALLFGAPAFKRLDVVLDAFATLDDWTLVVGGPVADFVETSTRVLTFPGILSDAERDLLFSAVDVVVLAFTADYQNNSGTLMDAISVGTPVVCPYDAAGAAIITTYRLGRTFRNDDPDDLARAVAEVRVEIAPADLATARRDLSNRSVARQELVAVGVQPPT